MSVERRGRRNMGQFSDNYERQLDRWTSIESRQYQQRPATRPRTDSHRIRCNACGAVFATEPALHSHNFQVHPISSFYVRVNGRVAGDLSYVEQALTELEVVTVGNAEVRLSVRWSNTETTSEVNVPSASEVDLIRMFGIVDSPGEVRLWATTGSGEHLFRIYVLDPPHLDNELLDEIVYECQLPLMEGHPSNWQRIRDTANRDPDGVEHRYLLGFASYLHGCDLDAASEFDAARLAFESAFRKLGPFPTALARNARAVLEFRMHAMELLYERGPSSVFWQVANFFDVPMRVVTAASRPDNEDGIWMDDFQEGVLEAVKAICGGDLDAAATRVGQLPRDLAKQADNELKFQVLSARLAFMRGDLPMARAAYTLLREDPTYSKEALERL
jgi:hypothetical protein